MNTSYADRNAAPVINWTEELEDPPVRDGQRYNALRAAAFSWVTCACGQQDERIPRIETPDEESDFALPMGAPKDKVLRELGNFFYDAVRDSHWSEAKRLLAQIETRTETLIKEFHETKSLPSA
jgi:hypothetical protein